MNSKHRAALLIASCVVLGLVAAYMYWPAPPRKLNDFQLEQLEIARRNEELAQKAAQALPHSLPNEAPAADFIEGPPGKVLPVRMTWQAESAESGILDQIDGCIMVGPGVDFIWRGSDLFVMKQKGLLRRLWSGGKLDSPFGPMDRATNVGVCHDGKFVWAYVVVLGHPRMLVLDPITEQVWDVGWEDVPREPAEKEAANRDSHLTIAPWEPGKIVVAGWPGQTWLVVVGFDPERGKSVEPLPPPVDLESKRSDLLLTGQTKLTPAEMWLLPGRASDAERQSRRLLIRRSSLPQIIPPAWLVDPETSRFELVGGASLGAAMQSERFAVGDGALFWMEHAPSANPQPVLARARLPELSEQVALTGLPESVPVFHDGWLWLLGDGCFRMRPDDRRLESIKVDLPWQAGFRDRAEPSGRNESYYTISRAYPSQNYGLLVMTRKQQRNAYNNLGKYFQLGLADDPRLKSDPSGDSSSAAPDFAAAAPDGTIVSLLEVAASDQTGAERPIAVLGPAIEIGDVPEDVGLPVLAREIVRQSLLSAARDRLGWLTRDAVLREASPDEDFKPAARFVLNMRFPNQGPAAFELTRLDAQGKSESHWKEELQIYPSAEEPCQYGKLVAAAERWSREAFPQLLEQAGLPRVPAAETNDAAAPESAEKQLNELNFTAQFMAIEELHDAARRRGASPAVIGGLVRGYANLGVLTECHWTAVHKACKARALLYGQQLAAAKPDSAWSLWHRAYAEALSGIHNDAQSDLAAAEKLSPANAAPSERPKWVELIEAFCRFDDERLAAAAGDDQAGQLARLLQFLAIETLKHSESAQELMERLLAENPECFRVHDARSWGGSLGTMQAATLEAPAQLQSTLPKRLRAVEGLPSEVNKLLRRGEDDETLVADLARTLSTIGRDEDGDELSWRMLGELIQETQFLQCWRRVHFMRNSWSVPADEYVLAAAPLIARHRYRALVDLCLTTPQPQAAVELESKLELSELEFAQQAVFAEMLGDQWESAQTDQYLAAAMRPEKHMDDVHRDFCAWLASFDDRPNENANSETIARMRKLSPDSPDAAAAWIGLQGRSIEGRAAELEQKFARHVQVWRALAHAAWDKEPRIRRLRKCIELSHDLWAYETLAGIYRQDHRYDEWLAVLNESLTRPSRGLEHDRVRSQIAGYYMLHNEWEKALPYAVEAAGSWAEWAMLGAADCYEGLGDDENEGRWRARMAERYPSPANSMALYHWARRSGLGDAESLAGQLDPVVADWAENNAPSGQHGVGIFYQLSGRPRQALAAYQKAANDRSNLQFAYTAQLRLALVALELGDVRAREEALKALRAIRDPALADFQRLGAWLEQELARPIEEPPDLAAVRKTIAEAASNHRPSLNFAVGRFLELRDRGEEAEPFLDAAASSAESHKMLSRVLASAALRDRGATPSKLKTEPIPFEKPEQRPSGGGQGPASEK